MCIDEYVHVCVYNTKVGEKIHQNLKQFALKVSNERFIFGHRDRLQKRKSTKEILRHVYFRKFNNKPGLGELLKVSKGCIHFLYTKLSIHIKYNRQHSI